MDHSGPYLCRGYGALNQYNADDGHAMETIPVPLLGVYLFSVDGCMFGIRVFFSGR